MTSGNFFTTLRGLILVIPWALYLVLIDLIWSLLLPFSYFFPDGVYNASSFVAFTNWKWIQCIFEVFNGAVITMSGDLVPEGESAIVVSNHVSWTDFYMIQAMAIRAGMLGRCRWFAKIELRWVPLLGWGIWATGMPMVSRKWTKDKKELDRVFAGITVRKWPTCKSKQCWINRNLILILCRAYQLQRGYKVYTKESRSRTRMVRSKRQTRPKTSPLPPDKGLRNDSPASAKSQTCKSYIRYDNRIRAQS